MQGSGGSAAAIQKHYTLPAVAAAAIHYCFRARIPLPRQGTKSIEVVAEGFQLTIQHTTEVLRLHGELPEVTQVEVGTRPTCEPIVATGDAALDDPDQPCRRGSGHRCGLNGRPADIIRKRAAIYWPNRLGPRPVATITAG